MEENFTKQDLDFIKNRGNNLEKIEKQIQFFQDGISKMSLVKSATRGDGIWVFDVNKKQIFCRYFDKHKSRYHITKFVPASGAASRMFKFLSEFLNEFDVENDTINAYINHKKANDLSMFLVGLKEFPFYENLKTRALQVYPDFLSLEKDKRNYLLIKLLLDKNEFDFANKPKAILPFHLKNNAVVTPIEEHITEAEYYKNPNSKTAIHFTISKEHQPLFENITKNYPHFEITFSYQDKNTDTLAVNLDNTPFKQENGELLFRPGGHGALIENLNNLDADIIFIKNIDNVSQNHFTAIIENKKLLGGVLLHVQYQIFSYLNVLEKNDFSSISLQEIIHFVRHNLQIQLNDDFEQYQTQFQIESLQKKLNKPIRVCGMVKNEGEPGGGPFFVKDENGKISLQIVETSQIDLTNEKQKDIVENATHFNPVDLVCGVKNYKNEKFNLLHFIDENAGFIVEKNKNGKPLKAYELPGLWNGAMAKWITIFVEVPLATFNPVKTVNDLLKPAHQSTNE
jgi:hypothetical protein